MTTHNTQAGGIPTVPNHHRAPTAQLTDSVHLFAQKRSTLGESHRLDSDLLEAAPCGAACPHRLESISCPFFKTPCLVGARVKQVLSGEGIHYDEQEFFVVAQAGPYLIGEEVILNINHPLATRLRIVNDKRGRPVMASSTFQGSLLDMESATVFEEMHVDGEPTGPADFFGGEDPDGFYPGVDDGPTDDPATRSAEQPAGTGAEAGPGATDGAAAGGLEAERQQG